MSTQPPQLSVQDFAARIRAKYPGEYDALDDTTLTQKVIAKYPDYKSKVASSVSSVASSPASAPTKFEQERDPANQSGFWSNFGSTLKGFLTPQAVSPYPGTDLESKQNMFQGAKAADQQRAKEGRSDAYRWAASIASPITDVQGMERNADIGNVAGILGNAAGSAAPTLVGEAGKAVALDAHAALRPGLIESSHSLLNKAASGAKRQLLDVRQNVSDHVGSLVKDIAAADYADKPNGSIPLGDLLPEMDKLAQSYKAEGGALPVFDKFRQRIEALGPQASWFDVQKMRSEFGAALDAARNRKDVGASSTLYKSLTDKLSNRADEVGRTDQFKSYNQTWNKLLDYEREGALKQLLNSGSGQEFYTVLQDPKSAAELKGMVKDLAQYGMPSDWRDALLKNNKPLYDYVNTAGKSVSIGGKMKAVMRHPVAGGAGLVTGAALGGATGVPAGSWLGGMYGAVKGANMVDAARASRAIDAMGGAPEIAGNMGKRVEPVNKNAELPTTEAGAVDKADLVSALKSLGYSKEAATAAALRALKEGPKDFDTALRSAMSGGPRGQR